MYYQEEPSDSYYNLDKEGKAMIVYYLTWSIVVFTAFIVILSLFINYKVFLKILFLYFFFKV